MRVTEIEVGTKLMLDDDVLVKFCKERRSTNNFFDCSGDFGAELYPTSLGMVIRNCGGYDRFGEMCYAYDFYIPSRNVLIHSDERFVVDAIGGATVTLRSLDEENVSFWLDHNEFAQVAFVELDS